jgi:probable HAF family extracellular repeat protein
MSRTHGWFAACSSVVALSLFAHLAHAQQYSLIELDTPAAARYTGALGINDNDQVVGVTSTSPASEDPTLWNGTIATALDLAGGISGAAFAINNAGLIVGTTYTMLPNGAYQQRATLWSGGLATLLPTLGGTEGLAVAINQLGQAVGWSVASVDPTSRAVVWDGATVTDLGVGTARDINNLGQVIGLSSLGATLWNGTTATALGINMEPVAINDAGTIVGNTDSYDPNTFRWKTTARRWSAGTAVVLTGPVNYQFSTSARDINNAGQIVGYSDDGNSSSVATLWNGTSALDLNTVLSAAQALHINLTEATAINDLGYIVVKGIDTDAQQQRSYVLAPVPVP